MNLTILEEKAGGWSVWISLADEDLSGDSDVTAMTESFVIGSGINRKEAIEDAVRALAGGILTLVNGEAKEQRDGP